MLAVFNSSVAKCPDELKSSSESESVSDMVLESEAYSALKDDSLLRHFTSLMPEAITVNLGSNGFLAFSSHPKDPSLPRVFSSADGIFCMFQGCMTNLRYMQYNCGLNRFADECSIIVESYRSTRGRTPFSPDRVMRYIKGKFAFILYDHTTKSAFFAVDADGSVPLYWGVDAVDNLVLSMDIEIVKKACGTSLGPFPNHCLFKSSEGLSNYEFPRKQELIALPWEDGSGQSSGVAFVLAEGREESMEVPIRRAASDDDQLSST